MPNKSLINKLVIFSLGLVSLVSITTAQSLTYSRKAVFGQDEKAIVTHLIEQGLEDSMYVTVSSITALRQDFNYGISWTPGTSKRTVTYRDLSTVSKKPNI